jgi:Flp pilus assembly pilin Flp
MILKSLDYRSATGNTLTEYAVIGAVLLVVSLGGVQLMGGNLTGWFGALHKNMDDTTKKSVETQGVQKQKAAEQMAAAAASAAPIAVGNQGPPSLALTAATIPPSKPVNVVGSNGTTSAYANQIIDKAKESLAKGAISQGEYDLIMRLANKGHDIAAIQGLMENAYNQTKGNPSAYANTRLTFNGQSYTPAELNAILEGNVSEFSGLRKDASTLTGVLYDQGLLISINDNGGNIINSAYATRQQNQTAASFVQYQNEGIGTDAGNTHQQSGIICTNGHYSDNGTSCQ